MAGCENNNCGVGINAGVMKAEKEQTEQFEKTQVEQKPEIELYNPKCEDSDIIRDAIIILQGHKKAIVQAKKVIKSIYFTFALVCIINGFLYGLAEYFFGISFQILFITLSVCLFLNLVMTSKILYDIAKHKKILKQHELIMTFKND